MRCALLYALVAYYFSSKMARLVILLGPVASALGGITLGFGIDYLILAPLGRVFCHLINVAPVEDEPAEPASTRA